MAAGLDIWVELNDKILSLGKLMINSRSDTNILCSAFDKLCDYEIKQIRRILVYESDDDFVEGRTYRQYSFIDDSHDAVMCRIVMYSYARGRLTR